MAKKRRATKIKVLHGKFVAKSHPDKNGNVTHKTFRAGESIDAKEFDVSENQLTVFGDQLQVESDEEYETVADHQPSSDKEVQQNAKLDKSQQPAPKEPGPENRAGSLPQSPAPQQHLNPAPQPTTAPRKETGAPSDGMTAAQQPGAGTPATSAPPAAGGKK
jgi:hypothetical protein